MPALVSLALEGEVEAAVRRADKRCLRAVLKSSFLSRGRWRKMWDTFRRSRAPKTAKAESRGKAKSPTPNAILRKLGDLEGGFPMCGDARFLNEHD